MLQEQTGTKEKSLCNAGRVGTSQYGRCNIHLSWGLWGATYAKEKSNNKTEDSNLNTRSYYVTTWDILWAKMLCSLNPEHWWLNKFHSNSTLQNFFCSITCNVQAMGVCWVVQNGTENKDQVSVQELRKEFGFVPSRLWYSCDSTPCSVTVRNHHQTNILWYCCKLHFGVYLYCRLTKLWLRLIREW